MPESSNSKTANDSGSSSGSSTASSSSASSISSLTHPKANSPIPNQNNSNNILNASQLAAQQQQVGQVAEKPSHYTYDIQFLNERKCISTKSNETLFLTSF